MSSYSDPVNYANNNNNSSEDLKALDKLAESHFISVLNIFDKQVKARRKRRKEFEEDIYQKWKKPVDLLEGLIDFCLNAGKKKKKELSRKGLFNKI
jgi:hypothetical protein